MKTLLIAICLFTFVFCTFAQSGTPAPTENLTLNEGKVSLEKTEFEVYKKNFKYLLRRKRPLVKISFADGKEINEDSLDKIKGILETHWGNAISFYYRQIIKKYPNANASKEWENKLLERAELLKTYTFNAPNGNRKFSHNEASEMLSSLNKSAAEIIETAENLNGEFQDAKILTKTPATSSGCERGSSRTRILITFDKSGKVTDAEITEKSGCDSFDKNSLKTAKKIKFEPARFGNEPITVKKTVIYVYRRR